MIAFVTSVGGFPRRKHRQMVCRNRMEMDTGTETDNEPGSLAESTASSPATAPSTPVCPGCGNERGPVSGCNGEGRIIGGLGAVVNWWPIKAYRPCPEFLKTNKKYRRAGQSLDEIAFGRKGAGDDISIGERLGGD